jgi:hypothetical protein
MMHTIASHTAENRMTPSAVAACMAPLLLRPLLAGECEMDDDFDMNSDSAAQLIAAANAANSAQGIVTTLLEEYESIFNVSFLCYLSIFNICQIILLLWTITSMRIERHDNSLFSDCTELIFCLST